jgi:hypothetical protein
METTKQSTNSDMELYETKKHLNNKEYEEVDRKIKLNTNVAEKSVAQESQQIQEEERNKQA